MKLPIAELFENGPGTQVPTGPCERGISVHIFRINPCTGIKKHLNGRLRAERSRAVQGCFPLGSAIAHEMVRGNRWRGRAIGVRTIREEHSDHRVMGLSIGGAEGRVQWLFTGVRHRVVYVRTLFDQVLAKTRVSVESGRVEAVVVPQRLKRFSMSQQELDGADIAVVGAPLKKRDATLVCRGCRVTPGDVIKHKVGASVCDSIEYVFAHIPNVRSVRRPNY